MLDPRWLSDDELKAVLLKHGVKAGPVVASTRALYERKLMKLLQPSSLNGTADAGVEYSDSEAEEGNEEEEEEESVSQQAGPENVSHLDQDHPEDSQEPATDILTEMFPEAEATPTGIVATRRRPIKGAAGRPVQFKYPDTVPLSPATLERQEQRRRLVPLWVQLAVFVVIACLLYLLHACVEGGGGEGPLATLLESLSLDSLEGGAGEEAGLQPEPMDAPAPGGLPGWEEA